MKEFIDYLERKIEGCDNLGGMEREKAVYQSVLKDYRKQLTSHSAVNQSKHHFCSKEQIGQRYNEQSLGKDVEIDWSDIRVICLAPEYKKYCLWTDYR